MVELKNYSLFVDKRQSKTGKTYFGLYISLGDKEQLISFISESLYNYVSDNA